MPRVAKGPWFRKERNSWNTTINGQAVSLGTNKKEAFQKFRDLQGLPPKLRMLAAKKRSSPAARARLRVRMKENKVIEAAACYYAEGKLSRLGIRFQKGDAKAAIVAALRTTEFADAELRAAAIGFAENFAAKFRFWPDSWMVKVADDVISVALLEVEHTSPMSLPKMLVYSQLAVDLKSLGGSLRLFLADRYGTPKELDIIGFGDCLNRAQLDCEHSGELKAIDDAIPE